jgi:hypothetical protein
MRSLSSPIGESYLDLEPFWTGAKKPGFYEKSLVLQLNLEEKTGFLAVVCLSPTIVEAINCICTIVNSFSNSLYLPISAR